MYCKNCGHGNHCGERLIEDIDDDVKVEICKNCQCNECRDFTPKDEDDDS
jgi:hypothetical protein